MSNRISISALKTVSEIKRVYSGKPGCACGCRGTYYPNNSDDTPTNNDLRMFAKVKKIFESNLDKVYSWEDSKDKFVALDLTPTRTYTIYYQI